MKRVNIFVFAVLVSAMFVSCFKDKGNYDYTQINRYTVIVTPAVNNREQTYWVVKPTNGADSVTFRAKVSQNLAKDSTNIEMKWVIVEDGTSDTTIWGDTCMFRFPKATDKIYDVAFYANDVTTGLEYLDEFLVKTRQPFNYAWAVVNEDAYGDMQLGFIDYKTENGFKDSAEVVVDGYLSMQQMRRFKDLEHVVFMAGARLGEDRLVMTGGDSAWVLEPNSLEVLKEQEDIFWNKIPVRYALFKGDPGHNTSAARGVMISDGGKMYVSDRWGYFYDVNLDASVEADYTLTDVYPMPGEHQSGYNIAWDGGKHQFYYQVAPRSQTSEARVMSVVKESATLKNVHTATEDMPTDAELAEMSLVWLGKGIRSVANGVRPYTTTALMRKEDGTYRFIHFGISNKGDGLDEVVVEDEAAVLGNHVIDENTCFAATSAFNDYLFFTDGSQVYCLFNSDDEKTIVEIGNPVNGTIVDMDFRVTEDAIGGTDFDNTYFHRVLAVAYNTPVGVGEVKEIFLTVNADVDHETIHSGFGRISEITYMPRRTVIY